MRHLITPQDFKYLRFLKGFDPSHSSRKTGIALFGVGRIGTVHFENLLQSKDVRLHYVVDENKERLKVLRNQTVNQDIKFLTGRESLDILQDPRIQGVMITTPTPSHCQLILKSLHHGKTVFSEKPVASDLKDVQACYDLSAKVQRPIFCGMQRRFDPSYAQALFKIRNKEIGKILIIKTTSRDPPSAELSYLQNSSGIFHDSAIHDIDLICWLFGEYPTKVFATGFAHTQAIKEIGDYDTVSVQLMFPSGGIGLIDVSRLSKYGYDQRLEVFGGEGMIVCGHHTPMEIQVHKDQGVLGPGTFQSFVSRYEQAYRNELEHFIQVVNGKEDPIVTRMDVVSATKIATACKLSAQSGQCVDIEYEDQVGFGLGVGLRAHQHQL